MQYWAAASALVAMWRRDDDNDGHLADAELTDAVQERDAAHLWTNQPAPMPRRAAVVRAVPA